MIISWYSLLKRYYKTIETKNGSYDIYKRGNLFSVEIAGDEIVFDTEEEVIAAINEDANY